MKKYVYNHEMFVFSYAEEMLLRKLDRFRMIDIHKIEKCYFELSGYSFAACYHFYGPRWISKVIGFYFNHRKNDEVTTNVMKRFFEMDEEEGKKIRREILFER